MPQNNAIQVERLVKRFGDYAAVDGLDLTVRTGEVHGFSAPTAPASPRRSGSCWGSTVRTPAGSGSWASIRLSTPRRSPGGSPTCQGR
jgi:hypothetical protein